jgi:hypothetical protein
MTTPKPTVPISSDWATSSPATKNNSLKAAARSQFEEQCFLMHFYEQIHNRVGARGGKSPNEREFKNFSRLMATPSTIKEILGKLTRRAQLARYMRSTPAEQAALVPVISIRKLYKSYSGIYSKEIKFEDYTKLDSIMRTKEARGHGAGIVSFNYVHDSTSPGNSMVMKCKIKFYFQSIDVFLNQWTDGVTANGSEAKVSYVDLINMDTRTRENQLEIAAMVGDLPNNATHAQKKTRDFFIKLMRKESLSNYEIKAFIGWNTTRKHLEQLASGDLYDSVMNTGYAIRLNLHKHQLDFQEDGSIMLSTDWVGGIESKMNSPVFDILRLTRQDILGVEQSAAAAANAKLREAMDDAIKEKQEKCKTETKLKWEAGPTTREVKVDPEGCRKATMQLNDVQNSGALADEMSEGATNEKIAQARYSKFFDVFRKKLLTTHGSGGFAKNRLFFIDVPRRFIEVSRQEGSTGATTDAAKARAAAGGLGKIGMSSINDAFFEDNIGFATSEGASKLNEIKERINEQTSVRNDANMSAEERAKSAAEAATDGVGESRHGAQLLQFGANTLGLDRSRPPRGTDARVCDPDKKRIYWFYFGDLLDAAMEVLRKQPDGGIPGINAEEAMKDMSVLLGPVAYTHPEIGEAARTSVINIADIPVSLNLFVRWWLEKCVIPQKAKFPLREFIVRTTTDLASAALGKNCFPLGTSTSGAESGYAHKRSELSAAVKVGFSVVDVPKMDQNGQDQPRFQAGKSYYVNTMPILPAASYEDELTSLFLIYVYQDAIVSTVRTGDRIEDEKSGVYHLTHGRDRGIVHKMSFSRDQHPSQQAAHIQNAADNTDPNGMVVAQFGGPYDCKVTTFGCSAFAPGQFVYIKPTMLYAGLRAGEKFTTKTIMMEGYYHINKVEGVIEGGKYETILDCKFQYPAADADAAPGAPDGVPPGDVTPNEPRPDVPPPGSGGGAS